MNTSLPEKSFRYIMNQDETFWDIAKNNTVTPGELMLANPGLSKNRKDMQSPHPGEEIHIPAQSAFSSNINIKKSTCFCQITLCECFILRDQQG